MNAPALGFSNTQTQRPVYICRSSASSFFGSFRYDSIMLGRTDWDSRKKIGDGMLEPGSY